MPVLSQSELCLDVAKLFPRQGQWSDEEYLKLTGEVYESAGVYRSGELAVSALLSGFSVDVKSVFDAK